MRFPYSHWRILFNYQVLFGGARFTSNRQTFRALCFCTLKAINILEPLHNGKIALIEGVIFREHSETCASQSEALRFSFKNCLFSLALNQLRMHLGWTKRRPLNPKRMHPFSCLCCLNVVVSEAEVKEIVAATQCRQSLTRKCHSVLKLPKYRCLPQFGLVMCFLKQAVNMEHPSQEGFGVPLQAFPLPSLWMLSYARAGAQPPWDMSSACKDTTYLIRWRSKEGRVFSRRFILSDVRDNLTRCSCSRQCVVKLCSGSTLLASKRI